jgi:hypothetical protein
MVHIGKTKQKVFLLNPKIMELLVGVHADVIVKENDVLMSIGKI